MFSEVNRLISIPNNICRKVSFACLSNPDDVVSQVLSEGVCVPPLRRRACHWGLRLFSQIVGPQKKGHALSFQGQSLHHIKSWFTPKIREAIERGSLGITSAHSICKQAGHGKSRRHI